MIKINLLPKTINEKAIIRNTAILFAVLLVAIMAAGFTVKSKLAASTLELQAQTDAAKQIETRVKDLQSKAQSQLDSIKPIETKLKFIDDVVKYNQVYPDLYAKVARWTYDKVSLSSMSCDGTQVTITASVKSLDDLGRFLLNMYRATDLFTSVSISGVPGYGAANGASQDGTGGNAGPSYMQPSMGMASMAPLAGMGAIASGVDKKPAPGYIMFTAVCKLKTPITAPAFAGTGGSTAGAAGATGAAPMAMPSSPMPGAPMPGGSPMGPGGPK